ncbi:MAG: hypothetical protein QXH80_00800 [Candidatus Nanoarchaeia archaeon]
MKTRLFLGLSVGLFLCLCAYADVDPESSTTAEEAVSVETPATLAVAEEPTTEAVATPETKKAEEATATENEAPAATVVPEEKTAEETPAATVIVEEKTVEAVVVPAEPAAEKPVVEAETKETEQVPEEKPAAEESPAPVVEGITVEAVVAPAETSQEKPAVEAEAPTATKEEKAPVSEAELAPAPVIDKPKTTAEAPAPAPATTDKAVAETEKKDSSEHKCMCSKIGRAILFYIPNRILDLNDSISMDIGAGAEAAAEVGITKYAQFGGSYGSEYFLAKGYNHQYGGGYSSGWSYSIVPPVLDEKRYIDEDDCFGTVKPYIIEKDGPHIESRNAEVYKKQYRDFWAIRVSGGWFVTAQVEVHPIDLADFILGFFFIDFKENDLK